MLGVELQAPMTLIFDTFPPTFKYPILLRISEKSSLTDPVIWFHGETLFK